MNIKLASFDHDNLKQVLEVEVVNLQVAARRLKTLIDSLTSSGFDWENTNDTQAEILQELLDNILSDI